MTRTRVEIYASKKGTAKILFYAICLIALSVFVILISEKQQMLPPSVAKTVGYMCLLLFAGSMLYVLYRLSDHSPRIILDENGLTDNSAATSPGFIPWSNIEGFKVKTIHSTPLLGIITRDPKSIHQSTNVFSQFINRLNETMFRSSFMLSTKALDIDFEEFVNLTEEFHQKYTGSGQNSEANRQGVK